MGRRTITERFWEKVNKDGPIPEHCPEIGKCWEWEGCRHGKGYGHFKFRDKVEKAHRASWMIHHSDSIQTLHVLHKCDNPSCVNPRHLFLGTNADNMRDRGVKNRAASKITAKAARAIRSAYKAGGVTQYELANRYGISQGAVSMIVSGERWRYLDA